MMLDHNTDLSWIHRDIKSDKHISNTDLSWIHRDIKSANILLDENWESKISDFGLSKIGPSNLEHTFLVTTACGTYGYVDPLYVSTGIITKESDVYSFGVVLFEILCGRLACVPHYHDERRYIAPLVKIRYEQNRLDEIIHPDLRKQMKLRSLNNFSMIAYQCLKENRNERPSMGQILEELLNAFEHQASKKLAEIARVGPWGRKIGGPQNYWSLMLENGHHLKKITIEHGEIIYSLILTTECEGVLHNSDKAGGWAGGETVSEVMFDDEEEIIGMNGTVGMYKGYTVISSISFLTNKSFRGSFGKGTESAFSISWNIG